MKTPMEIMQAQTDVITAGLKPKKEVSKVQTFESWLQMWHAERVDERSCNGDMLAESYEHWVTNLDSQEVIDLAEIYGKDAYIHGMKYAADVAVNAIKL